VSRLLYRLVNPLVSGILRSPLHGLLSSNTLLLEYRGRRSGRLFRTPVSYCEIDGDLHCFAGSGHRWWRNLADGEPIAVVLRGRRLTMAPLVNRDDRELTAARLRDFLIAVPRDAPHAGVRLDEHGHPHPGDIRHAAAHHVHVRLAAPARRASPQVSVRGSPPVK
jgi:hypothetical protein